MKIASNSIKCSIGLADSDKMKRGKKEIKRSKLFQIVVVSKNQEAPTSLIFSCFFRPKLPVHAYQRIRTAHVEPCSRGERGMISAPASDEQAVNIVLSLTMTSTGWQIL